VWGLVRVAFAWVGLGFVADNTQYTALCQLCLGHRAGLSQSHVWLFLNRMLERSFSESDAGVQLFLNQMLERSFSASHLRV
jgi:hypothetical protein